VNHHLKLISAIAIALLPTGCYLYTGGQGAAVVIEKVSVSHVQNGTVSVTGAPGAVIGQAYGVTLTVRREGGYLAGYRVQHLTGSGMSIISGYALVNPDGSFSATTLGDPVDYVKPGDELNIKAYQRIVQEGVSTQLLDVGDDAFATLN
jgi:hypothetical protein